MNTEIEDVREARLILVGKHECVTCERCACTFAAVHPACPPCSERGRIQAELERLQAALDEALIAGAGKFTAEEMARISAALATPKRNQ